MADYINEITILVVCGGRENINKIIEQSKEVKVIDNLELFRRIYNPSDYILQYPKEFIKTDVDYDTTDHLHNKNINYGKTLVRKPNINHRRKLS